MNFYKRFMGDYAKKTARLTLAQHGAYTLLLDEVYVSEQPLPGDPAELFRICRAMNKAEQEAVRYVVNKYFPVGSDGLRHNERAEDELIQAAPALEAARLNGRKGGRPKKEPNGIPADNPVGFQNITQDEPSSKPPHSPDKDKEAKASSSASLPDCPHESLIDLYAEHLPSLPQPRKSLWHKSKNAQCLKARWRWVMTACHESGDRKGVRIATTQENGLAWFARFFAYVAESDWLTGKDRKWSSDLGWLVSAANFEKVVQGNYQTQGAAR